MDEIISELEMSYRLEPNLETGTKLYLTYVKNGLDVWQIVQLKIMDLGIIKSMMLKELIPLNEEFLEDSGACNDIRDTADKLVREMANEDAARAWSMTDDEDLWIIATFGWAEAVNGELLLDGGGNLVPRLTPDKYQKQSTPPENFSSTQQGGNIPAQEESVWIEHLSEYVAEDLDISKTIVSNILDLKYNIRTNRDMEISVPVSGEATIYKKDPLALIYNAKNLAQLIQACRDTDESAFSPDPMGYSPVDWDRIPTWGPQTSRVTELNNQTTDEEGLLSWDTRNPKSPKYLMFKLEGSEIKTRLIK